MINGVQSSGIAAYAQEMQQMQVRNQERNREQRGQAENQVVNETPRGEQVTISQEAKRLAQQNGAAENGQTVAQQTGAPQAVERKQLERPEEARAAVATTVAQQINQYRTADVIR